MRIRRREKLFWYQSDIELYYVCMELVFSQLSSQQLAKTTAEWTYHFLCLILLLMHPQYFTMINLSMKLKIFAEATFSLSPNSPWEKEYEALG